MKRIVLFDFFGVISSEVAVVWLARFFDKETAARIKDRVMVRADLGDITMEEAYAEFSTLTGVSPLEIEREWLELAKINLDTVRLVEEIGKTHPVYLLSNASAEFLSIILDKNNLNRLFKKVYISSELRIAKPDPEFFRACISDIGAEASECVMIDDNPKNIAAAESLGIEGIVFTGSKALRERLYK